MIKNRIDIISLGCSKNLVDSERLMHQLLQNGYTVDHDSDNPKGEIAVINTCGFIDSAKEESVNTILSFAQLKKQNQLRKLFVMGCLSERYMEELKKEIPEVDKFYGKFSWKNLLLDLGKSFRNESSFERSITTPSHYAYLKISEGCNRTCSYCSIPIITGSHLSRKQEEILSEVRSLVKAGVREFQVIAQDLSYYGKDVYGKKTLAELIARISDIKGVDWIRLHYAYPTDFPYDLLSEIRSRDNVCNYLDIALQHINSHMLKLMRRGIDKEKTIELIQKIREEVPGIHLRTTMMVGHPGEQEEYFQELIDFVKEQRFERLGAFPYSHEEGTFSHQHYEDEIADAIKQDRMEKLMSVQEKIAIELNEEKIGKVFPTIIDKEEEDYYIGRTEFDSPEVDPEVLIKKDRKLRIGEIVPVKVSESIGFDLLGTSVF